MAMPPRHFLAFSTVAIMLSVTTFATAATTIDEPRDYGAYRDDFPRCEPVPAPYFSELLDLSSSFTPRALRAVDEKLAEVQCGAGPLRVVVAPGRAACERQSVPSRSRRKLRTWELDLEV